MERILIQLGRLGDVINILPLAEEYSRNNKRLFILVSEEFIPLFQGVSYCDTLIYRGDYKYLLPAEEYAKPLASKVRTSQVWALDYSHNQTSDNFCRDSWNRIQFGHRFDQLALIFDRRDQHRESLLVDRVLTRTRSKPVVLLSLHGYSNPFIHREAFKSKLQEECGLDFDFVDISELKAERIYDLLGLFDSAECLIAVDTATVHLAQASSIPVIALVNKMNWLGSPRRANHIYRGEYGNFNYDQIKAALYKTQPSVKSLIHVYSSYKPEEPDRRRFLHANLSWYGEYATSNWVSAPCPMDLLPRSSKELLGEERDVPFVKDLIDFGFSKAGPEDAVVFTNTDIGFTPGMGRNLRRLLSCKGACYGYRRDFGSELQWLPNRHQVLSAYFCGGIDLFAFTKKWWDEHWAEAPDMLLGCTHWDLVYRDLIKKYGGGELHGGIWHETHPSYWQKVPRGPGNMHNVNLSNLWHTTNDPTRVYKTA